MDSIKNKICHIVSFFVILIHTATLTNIDCNGKPFHCVNSTHFKICVDLGAGVSTTFDDFVIQCPTTTVCLETNKFECEYQFPIGDETTDSKTNPHATTIVWNAFTNSIPSSDETRVNGLFNEYLSTIDVTTQAHHIEAMQTERQQVDYPVTGISTDSEYSTSISENKLKQFISTTDVTTDTTITNLESRSDSVGLLELLFKGRRVLKYEFPVTKSSDDVLFYDDTKITNNELSALNDPHGNSPPNYTNNTTVLTDLAENIKKIESNEINTLTTQTDISGHFKSETPVLHNFTTMRTLLSKILSPSLLPLSNYSESTYEANFINATSTSRSGTYNELPINSNTILSGATSDMTSSDETTLKDQEIIYSNNFSINTTSIPDSNGFTSSVTTMSLQSENDTIETQTETAYSREKLILQSVTTTNYSELLPEANNTNNASINKNLAESFGFNFSLNKDTFIKNSEDTLLNDITTKAESDDLFALSAIDSVYTNTLMYITPMILPVNSNTTILSDTTTNPISSDASTLNEQDTIYSNDFNITNPSIPASTHLIASVTTVASLNIDTIHTKTDTTFISDKPNFQRKTTPIGNLSVGWLPATNFSERLPEVKTTNYDVSSNRHLSGSLGFNASSLNKDTIIKNSADSLLDDITTKAESDDLSALNAIDNVYSNTFKYATPLTVSINSKTTILSDTTIDPISSDGSTLNEQDTIYSNNFDIKTQSIPASTHLIASVTTVASLNEVDTINMKTDTTFSSENPNFQRKTTPLSTLSERWLPATNFSERLPEENATNDVSSNINLSGSLGFNASSLNKGTIIKNSADSLLDAITTKAESDDLSASGTIDSVYSYTLKYRTPVILPVNSNTTILSDTTTDPISGDASTLNEQDIIYSNNFNITTPSIPASTHFIASVTTVASLNEVDTIDMKTDTTFSNENPKFQRKTTPLSTLSEGWLPATNFSERLPQANATNDVSSNINLSGSLGFNASSLNKGTIIKNSADSLLDDITTKAESDDLSALGTIDSVYSYTLKYRTPMILPVNSNTTILSDTTTDPISGDASTLNEQDTIYSNNFNITTPSIPASTHFIASVTTEVSLNEDETTDTKTDTTFSSEKPILQSIKTPHSSLLQVWLPASNYSESLLEANTTNDVTSIVNWSAKNASSLSEDTYLVNSQDILLDDLTTITLDSIFSNTFDHTTPTIASSTKKILNVIQKASLNDINTFTEANSEDSLIEMNKKDFDASSMQQKYTTKETFSFTHNPLQILWNELPLTTNLEEDRTTNNVLLDINTNVTSKESAGTQAQDIKIVNPLKQSLFTETTLSGHNPPELFPILPIEQELTKKFHTKTLPIYSVGLDNATTTSNINNATTEKEVIIEFTIHNDTLLGNPADTISLFISPQATTLSNHDIITTPSTGLVTNILNKDYLDEDSHNQEITSKAIKKKNWESVLNLNDVMKENLSVSVSQTEIPRFDDVPIKKNVFVDKAILSSQYGRITENTPNIAAATTINEITVNTTVVPYVGTVDMLQNVSTGIKLPVGFNISKTEKLSNFSSDKVYSSPGMTITTVKNKIKPGISQQLLKYIDESKADLIQNDKNISLIDGREYETNHDNSSTVFKLSRKNNESTTLKSERSTLYTTISSSDIKIYVDGTKAPVDDTYTSDKISLFEDYQAKTTRIDFNSIVTKSDPTKITTVVHQITSDAISGKDVTNTFLFSNPEQSNNLVMMKENKLEKNTEHDKLTTKEMYDHKIITESIRDGFGTLNDDKHFSMPNVTPFLKDNKTNKSLKFELRTIGQNFTSPEQITTKIITNKDLLVNDIKKISTQDNITTISDSTKRKINNTNLKFLPKYSERVNFQSKSTEPNIEHYVTSVNMEKSIDLPTHNPLFYDLPFEHTMKAEDIIISSKIKNVTSDQTDIFVSIDVVKNNTESSSTILEKNAELGRSDHKTILPSETSTTAQVHVITRDMLPNKLNASNTTSIYVDTKNNSSSGHSREVNIRKDNYNNRTLTANIRIKESNFEINTETENKLLTTSYIESHSGPNSDILLNEYKHKLDLSQPQTSTVLFEYQRTNKSALDLTVSVRTPKSEGTPEATLVKINLAKSMPETSTVSDLIAFHNIANSSQNISIKSDTVFNSTEKEVPHKIYKTVMAVNKQLTNQMLNTETAHIATASIQDEITLIIKREEKNVTELPIIKTDAISEIKRLKHVKLINNPNEKSEQPDDEVNFKQYTSNSGILKTSSTYLGESVTKDPLYHRPSTSVSLQNFKHTPFTTKLRNTSDTIPKTRSVIVDRRNVEELVIRKRPNITSPSNGRWLRNQTINSKTNQFGHGLRNPIIINKTKNQENSAKDVLRLFTCKNRSRGKYADINDCRSFFICIGKIQPIHGKCPVNTVYSEINKQCTKNLSHCIRNNQFRCIQEGRFSDMFSSNIYYICVRNKNIFIRFKLKCQLGYRLNKKTVICVNEAKSESLMISTSGDSDSKKSSDQSTSERKIKEKKKTKGDVCREEGKFPDPNDCRRYYVCSKNSKSVFRQRTKKCDSDEVFHRDKKKCVDSESYECN